ncbi:hypothetical protein [Planomonospora algeriensis]
MNDGDDRWRRLALVAAFGLPVLFTFCGASLLIVSGSPGYAAAGAAALTGVTALNLFLVAGSAWAARFTRSGRLWLIVLVWALQPALAAGLLLGAFGADRRWALAAAALVGVVAAPVYARQRRKITEMQVLQPLAVDSLRDAASVDAATRTPPDDAKLPAANRAVERLNRARALMTLAVREDDSDRVQEAMPLLRAALTDPALDPVIALSAADHLVNAESVLAERSRDGRRYAQAIDLLAEVVGENPGLPAGRAKLHGHRASYLVFRMRCADETLAHARQRGDGAGETSAEEETRELYRAVKREHLAAIDGMTPGTPVWAQELAMYGMFLSQGAAMGEEDGFDEAVELVRRALDRRFGLPSEIRPTTELGLADVLLRRAAHLDDDVRDLDEAEAILTRLVRHGPPIESGARALLLDLSVLRAGTG